MNLTELYSQVPVTQHGNIRVAGDRVYFTRGGRILEGLMQPSGELTYIGSRPTEEALAELKAKWAAASTTDLRVRVIAEALGLL